MKLSSKRFLIDSNKQHLALIQLKNTLLHSGGHLMTDNEKEEEVAESQKLTKKDKQEIQEGLCVNCALLSFIVTIFMIIALVL